jgi:predicted AAA+ superfamily ATPase
MEILLDEFYKQNLHVPHYVERKVQLDEQSYEICGITQSGKTTLVKKYLLTCKKSHYIYIDCRDIRIDIETMNTMLTRYCNQNHIEIVVLDNYTKAFVLPNVKQLLITTDTPLNHPYLPRISLTPLDYEEFLAYEPKYDSTALNHFLQLGGLPVMHTISSESRQVYIQQSLSRVLSDIEFEVLLFIAKSSSLKLSTFSMYEKLKGERKVSKDMLYRSVETLLHKQYLFQVAKHGHSRAVKKSYLCDIAFKNALTHHKNFRLLFENLIFLELNKRGRDIFYDEKIDFYIPQQNRIILCMPFSNEDILFKTIEKIEEFIITHGVSDVKVVTMSSEGQLSHPFVNVEMLPFSEWAIIEGE